METNILCEKEERTALANLYEGISVLLQDSDDEEEKRKIKKALQGMSANTTYIVLGETGSGKTGILRNLFQDVFEAEPNLPGDICEYRWGEQEFSSPVSDGFQKRFLPADNMRGLSIIDTRGLNQIGPSALEKIQSLVGDANAIFVSLDAQHVNSARLWDLIENFPSKRMVFFLTKCDLLQPEELDRAKEKLGCYMRESDISAPIFPVSLVEGVDTVGTVPLEEVRLYVKEQLIGPNPILNKQRENVEKAKILLVDLEKSFTLRKKQYTSDAEILRKINRAMDGYVANHKEMLTGLIKKLEIEVNKDIDGYEKEIISKIDPYKIKERFRTKEAFTDYLNMVNENYKNMMSDSVNRKTIEVMKGCLHDLELVFKEAIGYFNTRENILELNDRFYGTLSKSKHQMVAETREVIAGTGELYKTLSDASEELFLQVWNAREEYDAAIRKRRALSVLGGGGAGGVLGAIGGVAMGEAAAGAVAGIGAAAGSAIGSAGAAAATAVGTVSTAAGAAVGTAGSAAGATVSAVGAVAGAGFGAIFTPVVVAGLVVVGIIVGAALVNSIAKSLYDPKAAGKMEETTRKCIEQFKAEVEHTRKIMLEQITAQITEIFEKELASVDSCFTEFRMSVNIDERKLPILEQKLLETEKLLQYIDNI